MRLAWPVVPACLALLVGCSPVTLLDSRLPGSTARVRVVDEAAGSFVVRAGRRFGPYDEVAVDTLRASPDGRRLAWAAGGEGGWRVYVDGSPGPAWQGVGELAWSRHGVVYAATHGDRWAVVSPRGVGRWHRSLAAGELRPCGPGAAYVARDDGAVVVVGERTFGPFQAAGGLAVTEDCAAYAFAYQTSTGVFVRLDDRRHGPFFDVAEVVVASRGAAASVLTAEGWRVIAGRRLSPPFAAIGKLALSRHGARLAYAARREGNWWLQDGERTLGPFDKIAHQTVTVSDDGKALAFSATVEGRAAIFVDGKEVGRYAGVADLVLASGARHYAAIVTIGQAPAIVVDGVEHAFQAVAGSLVFQGKHWGAIARDPVRSAYHYVIDGRRGPTVELWELGDLVRSQAIQHPDQLAAALRAWVRAELASAQSAP